MNEWGETERPPLPVTFHDIAGKSVLVTGGGSGIGAAITEAFIAQGAQVSFVQRSDGSAFCDEIEARHGVRPNAISCDITDVDALRAAIASAAEAQGAIEVLVNNAANDTRHKTEEVDEAFWEWSMGINLKAYFFACQAVAGPMRQNGGGAIINFSSIAYMTGMSEFPCYSSSNAAIVSLTHSFAREFGRDGIRVNALAPGMVLTPRQKELWLTPEGVAEHMKNQCLPQPLVPEDIVGSVLFLASGASRMMTGQTLIVDGGVVARS